MNDKKLFIWGEYCSIVFWHFIINSHAVLICMAMTWVFIHNFLPLILKLNIFFSGSKSLPTLTPPAQLPTPSSNIVPPNSNTVPPNSNTAPPPALQSKAAPCDNTTHSQSVTTACSSERASLAEVPASCNSVGHGASGGSSNGTAALLDVKWDQLQWGALQPCTLCIVI